MANFKIVNKTCGTDSCTVQFDNTSSPADTYNWDFGDGHISYLRDPIHIYAKNRDYYIVTLKVINAEASKENVKTDTVFIFEKSNCQSIGSFSCASELKSGQMVKDKMGDNNNNYYYFIVQQPGVAKIELSPVPSGSYTTVSILSEATTNSSVIKSQYGYPGEAIRFYAGPFSRDTFFIRVENWNKGNELYGITCTLDQNDPNELNGSFYLATHLTLGQSTSGTMLPLNDQDYFRFYQPRSGAVDIKISPVPNLSSNGSMTVTVYKEADQSTNIRTKYGNPGETMSFSVGPLEEGFHYIQLSAHGESTEKYSITVDMDKYDLNENNNTFSKATLLTQARGLQATIKSVDDVDYYRYTATTNGPAIINIDRVPAGLGYLYVEVYKAASSNDRISYAYYTGEEAVSLKTVSMAQGQTYYIKISGYNSESSEPYQINIQQ
ncbi:PKD domain-containing protein [Chitinophaga filiformis]|uniref:PKD domain-containing protein n=1 Tax=Chitinophaga filiformis TaxID=104663 RepID=A0A1G7XMS9_CHIFI|nr:PKD domain-containing protein [Chitinophaga filiformis]SDG85472.1 hypothetical protein SAMN04488121_1074 [Chitinophaga filiformis]